MPVVVGFFACGDRRQYKHYLEKRRGCVTELQYKQWLVFYPALLSWHYQLMQALIKECQVLQPHGDGRLTIFFEVIFLYLTTLFSSLRTFQQKKKQASRDQTDAYE